LENPRSRFAVVVGRVRKILLSFEAAVVVGNRAIKDPAHDP